ncbi:MAG: SH3 domain-containing protein, partial [Clostridia bacterium]|nr:SH3 domain-containing protein [Clostridia bacterium]
AAEESGISPYSIAIKIIQEVGTNGSNSVSGTCPGYEGYYNFYNWGATDGGNAVEKGLIYAKEKGWNNQYTAIVEGAKKMADSYVSVGQNTAYFYKFDVVDDTATGLYWHQFMTNVQDPSSQASNLYNTYAKNNAIDISLNFIIPVFKDMPESNFMPNGISSSDRNSYFINGTGVQFRDMPGTWAYSYGTLDYGEIVTVEELNHKEANGYTWAKIKTSNGTVGYVANIYLTKC